MAAVEDGREDVAAGHPQSSPSSAFARDAAQLAKAKAEMAASAAAARGLRSALSSPPRPMVPSMRQAAPPSQSQAAAMRGDPVVERLHLIGAPTSQITDSVLGLLALYTVQLRLLAVMHVGLPWAWPAAFTNGLLVSFPHRQP